MFGRPELKMLERFGLGESSRKREDELRPQTNKMCAESAFISAGGAGTAMGSTEYEIMMETETPCLFGGTDAIKPDYLKDAGYFFTPFELVKDGRILTDTGHKQTVLLSELKSNPERVVKMVIDWLKTYEMLYGDYPRICIICSSAHGGFGSIMAQAIACALRGINERTVIIWSVSLGDVAFDILRENASNSIGIARALAEEGVIDTIRVTDTKWIAAHTFEGVHGYNNFDLIAHREAIVNWLLFTNEVEMGYPNKMQTEDIVAAYRSTGPKTSVTFYYSQGLNGDKKVSKEVQMRAALHRAFSKSSVAFEIPQDKIEIGIGIRAPHDYLNDDSVVQFLNTLREKGVSKVNGWSSLSTNNGERKVVIAMELKATLPDIFYNNLNIERSKGNENDKEVFDLIMECAKSYR